VPFTGSHPAAVLPFLRTPLPVSAPVIGSMAPDIPYYLPWATDWPTHSAVGVVSVDLLLGAAAWTIWHGLLAAPALAAAPAGIRARLAGRIRPGLAPRLGNPRAAAPVVGALVLGSASHVLWDEFTHLDGWGTEHIPALAAVWHGRHGYTWAQDASSLVGGAVLLGWLARWWRRTAADPDVHRTTDDAGTPWAWAVVAGAGLLGALTAVPSQADLRSAAVAAAFRSGTAATAAALALAVAWHARKAADPAR
jgi:hypothetical protein